MHTFPRFNILISLFPAFFGLFFSTQAYAFEEQEFNIQLPFSAESTPHHATQPAKAKPSGSSEEVKKDDGWRLVPEKTGQLVIPSATALGEPIATGSFSFARERDFDSRHILHGFAVAGNATVLPTRKGMKNMVSAAAISIQLDINAEDLPAAPLALAKWGVKGLVNLVD